MLVVVGVVSNGIGGCVSKSNIAFVSIGLQCPPRCRLCQCSHGMGCNNTSILVLHTDCDKNGH